MVKAYSDDLRRKVLEAHAAGEGILKELAERFRVSVGWVCKISAALGKTGKMERQPGAKRGRVSKVTPEIESFIKEAIQRRSDIRALHKRGYSFAQIAQSRWPNCS